MGCSFQDYYFHLKKLFFEFISLETCDLTSCINIFLLYIYIMTVLYQLTKVFPIIQFVKMIKKKV